MSEFDFLEEQGVSAALIKAAEEFRQEYGVSEEAKHRRIKPALPFYGKETLEMAMAAVLEQENLLLAGPKATGKNVLAENLAYIFGRPVYNVSFHVNTNSGDLIGTDTFVDNQVKLRKADSVFWMRSIWRRMMRFLYFTPHWITAGLLMCQDMTK